MLCKLTPPNRTIWHVLRYDRFLQRDTVAMDFLADESSIVDRVWGSPEFQASLKTAIASWEGFASPFEEAFRDLVQGNPKYQALG